MSCLKRECVCHRHRVLLDVCYSRMLSAEGWGHWDRSYNNPVIQDRCYCVIVWGIGGAVPAMCYKFPLVKLSSLTLVKVSSSPVIKKCYPCNIFRIDSIFSITGLNLKWYYIKWVLDQIILFAVNSGLRSFQFLLGFAADFCVTYFCLRRVFRGMCR